MGRASGTISLEEEPPGLTWGVPGWFWQSFLEPLEHLAVQGGHLGLKKVQS